MAFLIGTSGWHYRDWKGRLYPAGLPASRWLEHYAARFVTVESNSAFYRLPEVSTFAGWAAATPGDFVMAVKASRYLTHVRRLRQPEEPVARLLERTAGLGPKLGPVLLQLPPSLAIDLPALAATLAAFPAGVRVAVEPRHPSWFVPATRELLEGRGAALCLSDTGGRPSPLWATTGWGYLRMHHGRAQPRPCYGRTALRTWVERLAGLWPESADVYVYFNNDPNGCAPRDAHRFAVAAARAGRPATRVPAAGEVPT
jgi:uncharacterized protein YecE (DUF72 family)